MSQYHSVTGVVESERKRRALLNYLVVRLPTKQCNSVLSKHRETTENNLLASSSSTSLFSSRDATGGIIFVQVWLVIRTCSKLAVTWLCASKNFLCCECISSCGTSCIIIMVCWSFPNNGQQSPDWWQREATAKTLSTSSMIIALAQQGIMCIGSVGVGNYLMQPQPIYFISPCNFRTTSFIY